MCEDRSPERMTRANLVPRLLLEQLLSRNLERFRGELVSKAHRLLYHSTLGSRVIKKKKKARSQSA